MKKKNRRREIEKLGSENGRKIQYSACKYSMLLFSLASSNNDDAVAVAATITSERAASVHFIWYSIFSI